MISGITHLPHIHAVSKCFQGSFQQDLSWQLATGVKDNTALNAGLHVVVCHTKLVVARLCGVLVVWDNFSALQSIHNLLAKPRVAIKTEKNKHTSLSKGAAYGDKSCT